MSPGALFVIALAIVLGFNLYLASKPKNKPPDDREFYK
ncbi:hypothetical protein MICH65_0749 [Candidatus Chazhemtobacterium aquaticus]|uniref:Uncharacterized protein n=1 Tax=Candidatus Chazhemtobacterium aquaticus TaxID=2715735 RepID=A0A857NBJ9_9BACT|nr:hypothetical protein MICH65_0749 [Candidatus Chazhemtobacterium aquaticus]